MSLPLVWGIQPALGQLTRTISTSTVVTTFQNGTEQRAPGRMPLVNFTIPFDGINRADKEALRSAVASAQGRYVALPAFIFAGVTYSNLVMMRDEWQAAERTTGLFTAELMLRQTIPQTLTAAGSLSAFPVLSAGVSCELPFGQGDRYQTDVNESPSGMRYSYPWFGPGALSGFPTRGLRRWPLSFPVLQDSDLAIIEQFFVGVNGQWLTFSFTDPDDTVTYPKCRFGMDDLVVTHQRFNWSGIQSLVIQETN